MTLVSYNIPSIYARICEQCARICARHDVLGVEVAEFPMEEGNATLNVDPVSRDSVNAIRELNDAANAAATESAPISYNTHMPPSTFSPVTNPPPEELSFGESPLFSSEAQLLLRPIPSSPTIQILERAALGEREMEYGTPGYGGILSVVTAEKNPTAAREIAVHAAEGDVAPIDMGGVSMAALMAHYPGSLHYKPLPPAPKRGKAPAKRKHVEISAAAHKAALKRITELQAEIDAEKSKRVKRAYTKAAAADTAAKKHRKVTAKKGKNPKRQAAGKQVWDTLTIEQQKHINKRRAEGLAKWKEEKALLNQY
jgi:hypothetical protein